jgi:flagellar L-ring protein precursor FlgH
VIRHFILASLCLSLGACASFLDRASRVGEPPELTAIENPTQTAGYRPVSIPVPAPMVEAPAATGSLWRQGSKSFFKDLRAHDVGDLLTVTVTIDDDAKLDNTSERSRQNSDSMAAPSVLGLESYLGKILPDSVDPTNLVETNSDLSNKSDGTIDRKEQINLKVAAVVTQKLPNGNLVILGRQEVRVNYEVRELQIAGIIRQEDITNKNTISYDQIAEARISYGGRGHISDIQGARYGSEMLDILLPF